MAKKATRSPEVTVPIVCTCGISEALQYVLNITTTGPVPIHSGTALPGSVRISPKKRRAARCTGSLRYVPIFSTNPAQSESSEKISQTSVLPAGGQAIIREEILLLFDRTQICSYCIPGGDKVISDMCRHNRRNFSPDDTFLSENCEYPVYACGYVLKTGPVTGCELIADGSCNGISKNRIGSEDCYTISNAQ